MVIAFLKMNPFHHKLNPGTTQHYKGGEYNGYVAFDKELPPSWQGSGSFDDDNVLDNLVNVHGGITFDRPMKEIINEPIIPITDIPDAETLKNYRVIGFDTLHYGDTAKRWPIEEVKKETIDLMEQIKKLCNE